MISSEYIYSFLRYLKWIIWQNVYENETQQYKGTLAKFNPNIRRFIRNIPEISNRLLQSSRILSGQYRWVPFMQKKRAIRLQMNRRHIISIYHKGRSDWNSKTVRNSKKALYHMSNSFMCERSNIYLTKKNMLIFYINIFSKKLIHLILITPLLLNQKFVWWIFSIDRGFACEWFGRRDYRVREEKPVIENYCFSGMHWHDKKTTKWVCVQRRFRSAWASAQSDQSLRCALNG